MKDRIPNIDDVDLEDDEILKQLIAECQGRGISPSNIKHLRDLKRFLLKSSKMAKTTLQNALEVRNEILGPGVTISNTSTVAPIHGPSRVERSLLSTDSDSKFLCSPNMFLSWNNGVLPLVPNIISIIRLFETFMLLFFR